LWFHAAAQPLEGDMLLAQAGQMAGAADSFEGGEQPKRHQDARINRRMARTSLDRLDLRIQRRQVQAFGEPGVPGDPPQPSRPG
jgi:hypothetical protein